MLEKIKFNLFNADTMYPVVSPLKTTLLVLVIVWVGGCDSHSQQRLLGQTIQAIEMVDSKDEAVSFSQLAGKPTLIYFWASWCKPCYSSITLLNELQQEQALGFQIVLVALDDDIPRAKQVLAQLQYQHTQWFAIKGTFHLQENDFANQRGVLPHTLLIDKNLLVLQSGIYAKSKQGWRMDTLQYL